MNTLRSYANIAPQFLGAQSNDIAGAPASVEPAVALEIRPEAPLGFSYTKVRLDTGEAIWRWPRIPPPATPQAVGGIIDVAV